MLVLEKDKFYIEYNELLHATKLVYKKNCTEEEFKYSRNEMLALFSEKKCSKHITDSTHMGVVSVDCQTWMANVILPAMISSSPSGVVFIAIVVSKDIFAKFAAQSIDRKGHNESNITRFFQTNIEAEDWLSTVN